jgi:hypothetical protein
LIYAQGQESGFGGGSQGYNSVVGEMMMKFYSEWVKSSSEITLVKTHSLTGRASCSWPTVVGRGVLLLTQS